MKKTRKRIEELREIVDESDKQYYDNTEKKQNNHNKFNNKINVIMTFKSLICQKKK
jgi:hypothetical protein